MKPLKYPALIKKDSEGYYIVTFPDWPNVNTFGHSLEEAKKMATEALTGALITDFERGFPLPAPSKKLKGRRVVSIEPDINVSLAVYLRNLRKSKNLSQQGLADRLDISYQAYQRLEHPLKCNPTLNTIKKLSNVLGMRFKINLF